MTKYARLKFVKIDNTILFFFLQENVDSTFFKRSIGRGGRVNNDYDKW